MTPQDAYAARYSADPADPSQAERLAAYSAGWDDCARTAASCAGWVSVEDERTDATDPPIYQWPIEEMWPADEPFGNPEQLAGMEAAALICDGLTWALDNAGNRYNREAGASKCASAIRSAAATHQRGLPVAPTTPPAAVAQAIAPSDADYWLASRAGILSALERAGFSLMSSRDGFWLQPTPAAVAQAADVGVCRVMADSTLATGAALTSETWSDFVARLYHDVIGDGVDQHHTRDAAFLVERRVWREVPEENSDIRQIYCDGHTETPEDFFADLDEAGQAKYNEAAGGSFVEAGSYEMRDALAKLWPDAHLLHVAEDWEFVCQHFTRDAADAFIKRKAHDYRDGLRVYVDCTIYSWELNAIKAAILDGRIGFIQPATSHPTPKE